MKLSKENIQFIDTYLQNHDVFYVDVRFEMIDHIASAVEEKMQIENIDFYDAFKNFMILNKNEILKQNKDTSSFSFTEFKRFFVFLLNPIAVIFAVIAYFILNTINIQNRNIDSFNFHSFFFIIVIIIAVFQILYFYLILKKRFYAIEKNGQLLFVVYYLNLFLLSNYGSSDKPSSFSITIIFFLLFSYALFFVKEILKFRKQQVNYI